MRPGTATLGRVLAILLVNAAGILGGAEIVAYGVARVRLGETYASARQRRDEALRRIPRWLMEAGIRVAPGQNAPDNLPRQIHPYFGYTFAPRLPVWKTNAQGFLDGVPFPYRPAPREAVIAILGGSVALDLRLPRPRQALEHGLLPALAAKGYDRATVVMFTQGGWKHPQQLMTYLYGVRFADVAILLDGFNEMAALPSVVSDEDLSVSRPLDFPAANLFEPLRRGDLEPEQVGALRRLRRCRERQLRLTERLSRGLASRSMLAHVVWRIAMGRWEAEIGRCGALLAERRPKRALARRTDELAELDRYRSFTRAALDIGRGLGKPTFHFLQPNQYVEGSKPFGDVERRVALPEATLRKTVGRCYPELRRITQELSAEGYPSYDLSMIFRDHPEQLYRDSCCHLKEIGMEVIAQEIVTRILESGRLQEMVPAEARSSMSRSK